MRSHRTEVGDDVSCVSSRGRRREEAAPAAVGPLAAPEFAVGRGLGFGEWNGLVHRRPDAGERAMDDHIAFAGHHHALLGSRIAPVADKHSARGFVDKLNRGTRLRSGRRINPLIWKYKPKSTFAHIPRYCIAP